MKQWIIPLLMVAFLGFLLASCKPMEVGDTASVTYAHLVNPLEYSTNPVWYAERKGQNCRLSPGNVEIVEANNGYYRVTQEDCTGWVDRAMLNSPR